MVGRGWIEQDSSYEQKYKRVELRRVQVFGVLGGKHIRSITHNLFRLIVLLRPCLVPPNRLNSAHRRVGAGLEKYDKYYNSYSI